MVTARKAARAVGLIVILGFCSKILGFLRELVLAGYYGATAAMDAFNVAYGIPGLILSGLGAAVATTFIPAFTRKAEREGKPAAFALSRTLFTGFALIGLILCGAGIAFAPGLARLLAPRFTPDKLILTAGLSRILLLTGTFTILNGLCAGLLQAQERFTIPALIGMPLSLTVIAATAAFAPRHGIYALAFGMMLAPVVQVLCQVPGIVRTGFDFRPSLDLLNPDVRRVGLLVLPVFAGTMLLQVNTVVDRIFASGLPVGSISALNYANRVNGLIVSIVAAAVATVSLPALSQAAAAKDLPRLRQTMVLAVRGMNAIIIPMTVGMVVLRLPLVRLLFERGAFDAAATAKTATALLYLSLGLFAYGLRDIFSRAFYALQDTLTPMINSGITIAVNVLLLMLLVPRFGLAGLAGATSLSGVFGGLQLFWRLRRKLGQAGGREVFASMAVVFMASAAMGAAVHCLYPLVAGVFVGDSFLPRLLALSSTSASGALIYLGMLWLLRAKEIGIGLGLLRRRTGLAAADTAATGKGCPAGR